jgi:hypothetical protein
LELSPTGSGQINTALGSSPLWLLEILRNHVVDKGHHAPVESDQLRDARLSADPVLQRSLNAEMSLGESTAHNVGRLPARLGFVMPAIVRNEALVKVAIKALDPITLGQAVQQRAEATVDSHRTAHLRAQAETVDHKADRTVGLALTVIARLAPLAPEGPPDREVIVRRVRLIAPPEPQVAFKTDLILGVHGDHVLLRVANRSDQERVAQPRDERRGRVSDLVGKSPPLGAKRVSQAGNARQVALIA